MRKLTTRDMWTKFVPVLASMEPFETRGALSGELNPTSVGKLPEEYRESFKTAVYAVYSYATPIAWKTTENEWIMPDHSYSVTTSRHQGKIRTVLSQF